jgi:hypothetical protein
VPFEKLLDILALLRDSSCTFQWTFHLISIPAFLPYFTIFFTHQIQASAPFNCSKTDPGYVLKSSIITVVSFGFVGSSRRERAMMDVIAGLMRHCSRTALPMKPVLPVRMTFMMLSYEVMSIKRNEDLT